ncbi:MAG: GTP-binding protein [Chaenotheca gracillima]|nr:MAG: GTP-binding protein [Chaenotheca gracillima]
MAETKKYKVRMLSKSVSPDLKDGFRVYLPFDALKAHGLKPGDPCWISSETSREGCAIAWLASKEISGPVVQTSEMLRSAFGLNLGDKISIRKEDSPVGTVEIVYLKELVEEGQQPTSSDSSPYNESYWEWFLEYPLGRAELIAPGMLLRSVELKGRQRSFRVERLDDDSEDSQPLRRFQSKSKAKILSEEQVTEQLPKAPLRLEASQTGGLASQVRSINEVLEFYEEQDLHLSWLTRPSGLLLYGPSGAGKSMLLNKISSLGWDKVLYVDASVMSKYVGEGASAIRKTFAEARKSKRTIVIIDQVDVLAGKRSSYGNETSVASILGTEMDSLNVTAEAPRVLVLGATNRINDVDETLRRPDRFEFEIEIPVPDMNARAEILKNLTAVAYDVEDKQLEDLASRTHGYTRADLHALVRRAGLRSQIRVLKQEKDGGESSIQQADGELESTSNVGASGLHQDEIERALEQIRPTAMREIFLEVPQVRWSDIGGQDEVKRSLKEVVEWPFKNPTRMKRLGIEPAKGLLLYGPPGCSKTMTARALATETGLNFIAVKGPEIFSMYVGETERRLREIFQKARAASPSIIFFDEIEAIASSRDGGQNNGIHTLTTLLNEMDGIEALKSVLILAATNKPEMLDMALLRPGRIDTLLYVGPPDAEARREILRGKLGKMDASSQLDVESLAQKLDGYSGAEIINVCDKAGSRAFRDSELNGIEEQLSDAHFEFAISKVRPQISLADRMKYEQWNVAGARKF